MLRWREVAVFLVLASVVSGDLRADLRAVTEAVKKSKTDDFLSSFDAAYDAYLRLCRARDDVVTRKMPMVETLKTGLQSVDNRLQAVGAEFAALVKKAGDEYPEFVTALSNEKQCEAIRAQYVNANSEEIVAIAKTRFLKECSPILLTLSLDITRDFSPIAGKESYVNKLRSLTFNSPRKMDLFVRGMVKLLTRAQVLELTDAQFSPQGTSDEFVTLRMTKLSQTMKKFIDNAKKVLKDIADGRMTQIKADIARYLKDKSTMTMCSIADTLLEHLTEKYESSNFGVLVFKGRYKNVVRICSGTYAFGVGDLNGIVVERRKSVDVEDRGAWMTEILNKLEDLKSNGEKHYAMMRQVLTKIGMQDVCKKLVLVAVIDTRASQCMMRGSFSYERRAKSVHRCNTSLCWIKRYWNYQVNLVG